MLLYLSPQCLLHFPVLSPYGVSLFSEIFQALHEDELIPPTPLSPRMRSSLNLNALYVHIGFTRSIFSNSNSRDVY